MKLVPDIINLRALLNVAVALLVVPVVLFVLLMYLVGANRIVTGVDIRESDAIRETFVQVAASDGLMSQAATVLCSPHHGRTTLNVSANLTETEQKSLRDLAERIGLTNGHRTVSVVFR